MNLPAQTRYKLPVFLGYFAAYSLIPIVIGCLFMVLLPYYPLLLTAELHKIDSAKLIDWLYFVITWAVFNTSVATGLYALLMSIARVRRFGLPTRLGLSLLAGSLAGMAIGNGLMMAGLLGALGGVIGLLLEVKITLFVYCFNTFMPRSSNSRSPDELKISES